jgi:hypothetical protein
VTAAPGLGAADLREPVIEAVVAAADTAASLQALPLTAEVSGLVASLSPAAGRLAAGVGATAAASDGATVLEAETLTAGVRVAVAAFVAPAADVRGEARDLRARNRAPAGGGGPRQRAHRARHGCEQRCPRDRSAPSEHRPAGEPSLRQAASGVVEPVAQG